ncbi:MAG: sigma-70 family RNA polymerase sigma factor [Verrucomicrobiales bacterium]|nr:sigma-70 family RNA polymerase sigma factor [Verrucomicrobiales bacterium]
MSLNSTPAPQGNSPFAPTRWTLVLRAQGETPEAKVALAELCEAYYQPVYRFLLSEGREADAARELSQEFFASILGKDGFGAADPERGRFRSYLIGTLKHFLSDQRKRERRLKRGGGALPESLDADPVEGEGLPLQIEDPSVAHPEVIFDRQWAMAVMAQGLSELQRDYATQGKADQFELLKPWLMGEIPSLSQAETGQRLGMSEGAVKVVIHRLRKRFREAVRSKIAQTLSNDSMVDDELRHLIEALV